MTFNATVTKNYLICCGKTYCANCYYSICNGDTNRQMCEVYDVELEPHRETFKRCEACLKAEKEEK